MAKDPVTLCGICFKAILVVLSATLIIALMLIIWDTGVLRPRPPVPVPEYENLPGVAQLRHLWVGVDGQGSDVWIVQVSGKSKATDSDLACMSNWPSLRTVGLAGRNVTGASLQYLRSCKGLRRLSLSDIAHLDDRSLSNLKNLTSLVELNIYGGCFSAQGAESIGRLTNLVELRFSNAPLSDEGLAHLANLRKLQLLELTDTKITDAGLVHLLPMNELKTLEVIDAPITDAGFRKIAKLPNLESLGLMGTRITARALDVVPGMPCLRHLSFRESSIKASDAEKLKDTAPKLTITGDGWEIKASQTANSPDGSTSRP